MTSPVTVLVRGEEKPIQPKTLLTDASFKEIVLDEHNADVIVFMWQPGCAPCKEMVPVLQDVARPRTEIAFKMMNSAANPATRAKYKVDACPMLLAFRKGQYQGRWKGLSTAEKLGAWVDRTFGG